jgi:hypothetical protein
MAFEMPNAIQPQEYSRGGGMGDILYTTFATFNRWNDERNVNVNRNDNDWNDNWWFAGVRKSLHFSPDFPLGEFCFTICPHHPPSILPISSNLRDRAIYFLLSNDFVSHKIMRKTLIVSTFRMAHCTYGSFFSRGKKLAWDTASMLATNKSSTLLPKEYRCTFGNVV